MSKLTLEECERGLLRFQRLQACREGHSTEHRKIDKSGLGGRELSTADVVSVWRCLYSIETHLGRGDVDKVLRFRS